MFKGLFATKSLEMLHAEAEGDNRLRRILGPVGLTSLGVGAIIGAGIFVMTGEVAANAAGPGILLSFVVAGVCCALAAFCYAEFASLAPVAGSAYTYAYATLGELIAWTIGWDLILEYAMSAATVAASWSKYLNTFLEVVFKIKIPDYLCNDPFSTAGAWFNLPAVLILAACTAVLVVGIRESTVSNTLLVLIKIGVVLFVIGVGVGFVDSKNWTGIPTWQRKWPEEHLLTDKARAYLQETARSTDDELAKKWENQALALHKIEKARQFGTSEEIQKVAERFAPDLATSEMDQAAARAILEKARVEGPENASKSWGLLAQLGVNRWLNSVDDHFRSPFLPYGLSGMMLGAALVFFAFLGFDAISTHAEEALKPRRDVPIGIIGSLVICSVLYMAVAAVITGMVPYPDIDTDAAVATAFSERAKEGGRLFDLAAALIAAGALAGMTSVLLITFLSQARIFLAMARDGLLPRGIFGSVHEKFRTPHVSTMFTGSLMCVVAAFTPIRDLEEMVNIGTFFAFVVVCAAVLILRVKRPDAPRAFRCPFVFVLAPLGVLINLLLMLFLPLITWARLVVWLILGLGLYFCFGYWYSKLSQRNSA